MKRYCRRSEHGYVIVLLAISIMVLFIIVGIAIGTASWYLSAARVQRSADAAALAGASALPDEALAGQRVNASLRANGIDMSDNSHVLATHMVGERITVTLTKKEVKTAFLDALIPHIAIQRKSTAVRIISSPALGSPFNVLGTGDLSIPGIPESDKQNFWLAVNGECSPMEDGDYFSSRFDKTKGPYDLGAARTKPFEYPQTSTAVTKCAYGQGLEENPRFDDEGRYGYSYYISVPAPPPRTSNPRVSIKLFDPAAMLDASNSPSSFAGDTGLRMARDGWSCLTTNYHLFWTRETPNDARDDRSLIARSMPTEADYRGTRAHGRSLDDWFTLYTVDMSRPEYRNGATFRLQVRGKTYDNPTEIYTEPTSNMGPSQLRGINAFSLGAFASWASQPGCDSRNATNGRYCPRVFGRDAMSVLTNLDPPSGGSRIPMFFAELDSPTAGSEVKLYLWDPGESVSKLELLDPLNRPMTFSWTAQGSSVPKYGADNVTSIDTSGNGGNPTNSAFLSNEYRFNDQLVTIRLPIPMDWPNTVATARSKWIKLAYTIGQSNTDRTTWGATLPGSTSSPPRLVK